MRRDWFAVGYGRGEGSGLLLAGNLDRGWVVVGFYLPLHGALRLADLTIVPGPMPKDQPVNLHGRPFGPPSRTRWLADGLYLSDARESRAVANTPKTEIQSEQLRLVPLGEMQVEVDRAAREMVEFLDRLHSRGAPAQDPELAEHAELAVALAALAHEVRAHDAEWAEYLRLAEAEMTPAKLEYLRAAVAFVKMHHLPNKAIAAAMKPPISPDQLRDYLGSARKLEYLTKVGRGRRGGELTDLGRTLAERHLNQRPRRSAR